VCTRARHRSRFSLAEAEALLEGLEARAEVAPDPGPTGAFTSDPDDDDLVALARETGCDAIVSGDHHLLDFAGPPPVWSPRELLTRLESGL
jgi:predicted nucleic acid-binding protein